MIFRLNSQNKAILSPIGSESELDVARKNVERYLSGMGAAPILNDSVQQKLFMAMYSPSQMLFDALKRYGLLNHAKHDAIASLLSNQKTDHVIDLVNLAASQYLPPPIEQYRSSFDTYSSKLLGMRDLEVFNNDKYLNSFSQTSAIADALLASQRVSQQLSDATLAFAKQKIPEFASLSDYGHFLDAAGLKLAHWPKVRLLTVAEKRRRFRSKLKNKTETVHVRQAKSLVHKYELTLRDILDAVMASEYGENWAQERLPICDCKDLLGKWKSRGGEVLDHADYAHYKKIMSNQEHYVALFEVGFDDPNTLENLITSAGKLRAASHHGRKFSQEDLRNLRLTWRTIETGLIAITPDYDVEI